MTSKKNIAIVAPSSVPFVIGGAENSWWALLDYINRQTPHRCELIKLPSAEADFASLMDSYERFSQLQLDHFDMVISSKYPAWMVSHRNHVVYMYHRLRGLYDTYHFTGKPLDLPANAPVEIREIWRWLERCGTSRDTLGPLFDAVRALRAREELQPWLEFPGPFSRRVVHHLDSVGMAPSAVRKYGAISRTVASRQDYFPAGAEVSVVSIPTGLAGLHEGVSEYLFTASRLDRPKRIDLLIDAMKHVKGDIELRIAGTGPEDEALRARAAGDKRIRFLGFLNDSALANQYANARAILFVPYDEDMGLITLEAMACAKPVITTRDAGGPNEFIREGETGFSVDPKPQALAAAIQRLVDSPELAVSMGRAARDSVANVSWSAVVETLLEGAPAPSTVVTAGAAPGPSRKRKIVVVGTFPVYPVQGGGQARIFHLWRRVARQHDVTLVNLAPYGAVESRTEIAPGLVEVCVPRTEAQGSFEAELSKKLDWTPVTDVAFAMKPQLTPRFREACQRELAGADLCVLSHPYAASAVEGLAMPDVWYEAHNHEALMKRAMYPQTPEGERTADFVAELEGKLTRLSSRVICVSAEDRQTLVRDFGVSPDIFVLAPNGVDLDGLHWRSEEEREILRGQLDVDGRDIAIMLASWHGPNLEAVEQVLAIAESLPEVSFLVVGSAGSAFAERALPANVQMVGVVSDREKDLLLAISTMALNPMLSGGGSNLKLLDYMAAGVPVVTTEFGARGTGVTEEQVWLYDGTDLAATIRRLLAADRITAETKVERARQYVVARYSWDVIAGHVLDALQSSALEPAR